MDDKKAVAIARGKRAELLLKDELLVEALDKLKASYIDGWEHSGARDSDGRERVWQAVQVLGKVREHLSIVMNNGKLAQRELDDLAKPQKSRLFGVV